MGCSSPSSTGSLSDNRHSADDPGGGDSPGRPRFDVSGGLGPLMPAARRALDRGGQGSREHGRSDCGPRRIFSFSRHESESSPSSSVGSCRHEGSEAETTPWSRPCDGCEAHCKGPPAGAELLPSFSSAPVHQDPEGRQTGSRRAPFQVAATPPSPSGGLAGGGSPSTGGGCPFLAPRCGRTLRVWGESASRCRGAWWSPGVARPGGSFVNTEG